MILKINVSFKNITKMTFYRKILWIKFHSFLLIMAECIITEEENKNTLIFQNKLIK